MTTTPNFLMSVREPKANKISQKQAFVKLNEKKKIKTDDS